jgi:hypothetical protein
MPNWCSNTLVINGTFEEFNKLFEKFKNSETGFFNTFVPIPEKDKKHWYEWHMVHWGTKWDVQEDDRLLQQFTAFYDEVSQRYKDTFLVEDEEDWQEELNSSLLGIWGFKCEVWFQTAWCPPEIFLGALARLYPELCFSLTWDECGCNFTGTALYHQGECVGEVNFPKIGPGKQDLAVARDVLALKYKREGIEWDIFEQMAFLNGDFIVDNNDRPPSVIGLINE